MARVIDPRRLRVLRALADHGTVTAAAHALYLSPSAVSQQLAALEAETGHTLLERRGRTVRLTAAGAVLARHAGDIAVQLERAEADLARCSTGLAGEVAIAAFATSITEVVAPAVAALRQRAPQVRIRVKDAEGHASARLLTDGDVDIALAVEHRDSFAPPAARSSCRPRSTRSPSTPSSRPVTAWPTRPRSASRTCGTTPGSPRGPATPSTRPCCAPARKRASSPGWSACRTTSRRSARWSPSVRAWRSYPARPSGAGGRQGTAVRPVGGPGPTRRVFTAVRRGSEGHPLLQLALTELRGQAAAMAS
ncbi:LysR family transcriptional regulator [Streptomyces olivoverticillatus]